MKFNRCLIAASTAVALSVTALAAPAAGAAEATPNQSSISAGTELSSNLGSSIDTGVAYADKDSAGDKATTGDSATTPDKDKDEKTGSSFGDLFRDKDGKVDPSKITAWIGVITAVIGALSTVMSQLGIRL